MALILDPSDTATNNGSASCSLEACIAALHSLHFDPTDPDCVLAAADWLRQLTANRTFLGDILLDQLAGRNRTGLFARHGPQAIELSPPRGNLFLRANIWPAEHNECFTINGPRNPAYGIARDQNCSFLTSGYFGPGYRSDHYEYDYNSVSGYRGEAVDLIFTGRTELGEGAMQMYRAHRDVNLQMPPESLSISLNVVHLDPSQSWFDQYEFDLQRRRISRISSTNANEAFLRVAVATGGDNALDFAEWVGQTHPSERLRLASFEARAAVFKTREARDTLWREGEKCGSRMVAHIAKRKRVELRRL